MCVHLVLHQNPSFKVCVLLHSGSGMSTHVPSFSLSDACSDMCLCAPTCDQRMPGYVSSECQLLPELKPAEKAGTLSCNCRTDIDNCQPAPNVTKPLQSASVGPFVLAAQSLARERNTATLSMPQQECLTSWAGGVLCGRLRASVTDDPV